MQTLGFVGKKTKKNVKGYVDMLIVNFLVVHLFLVKHQKSYSKLRIHSLSYAKLTPIHSVSQGQ